MSRLEQLGQRRAIELDVAEDDMSLGEIGILILEAFEFIIFILLHY